MRKHLALFSLALAALTSLAGASALGRLGPAPADTGFSVDNTQAFGNGLVVKSDNSAIIGESDGATGVYGSSNAGGSGVEGYSFYGSGVNGSGYIGVNAYGDVYGVNAYGQTAVSAYASSTPYTNTGVYASAYGGEYAYGIYANAGYGSIESWSGYFSSDVYVGGSFVNPSDIMFKKNVQPLKGGLAKILALKPKTYDMKVEEFKGKVYLPKGNQYGLIAQELEQVIPELVHPVTAPAELTPEERKAGVKKDPTKFKSVNYIALIPILIEAIQEQQAEIEALKRGR